MCIAVNVEVAAPVADPTNFRRCNRRMPICRHDVLASVFPTEAQLAVGYTFAIPIPQGSVTKRYVGLKFNNVSGTTGVTVSAHLIPVSHFQNSNRTRRTTRSRCNDRGRCGVWASRRLRHKECGYAAQNIIVLSGCRTAALDGRGVQPIVSVGRQSG